MRYHTFLRQSTYRRYGIFIVTVLFSWYGIQAYINNKNIDVQMEQVENTIQDLTQRTAYMNKFYSNYLQSEYAPYFAGHENGILYTRERIIRLKHKIVEEEVTLPFSREQKEKIILSTPQESRYYFIDQKLHFLIEW